MNVIRPRQRPVVYSVTETAQLLGISRTHAYELVARGEIPSIRLGQRIVMAHRTIERLIDPTAEPVIV